MKNEGKKKKRLMVEEVPPEVKRKIETWSLDKWVEMFKGIYGECNGGKISEEIWLHVVEEASELAEDLRKQHVTPRYNKKNELEGVLVNVSDTFAWLCAFVSVKFDSLQEIVWHKFPAVCNYCLIDKNCLCIARASYADKKEREKTLETYRSKRENLPKTLEEWKKMFKKIYGNVNKVQSLSQIGFHLMEEIGEVAKEIREQHDEELKDEIADCFAWLVGMIIKCEDLADKKISFGETVWKFYPNICPHCESKPCECKIYKTGPRSNVS